MAIVANNDLVDGLSGRLGASLVFRTLRGKTFVTTPARKPDKRKESTAQRGTRVSFRQASEWVQLTLLDPEKKAYYRQRAKALKLPNAYTAALTGYMRKHQLVKSQYKHGITYTITKKGFTVPQVQVSSSDGTETHVPGVVKKQYKDQWLVHYSGNAEALSYLTFIVTDNFGNTTRFMAT